jgi:hypothetical protein
MMCALPYPYQVLNGRVQAKADLAVVARLFVFELTADVLLCPQSRGSEARAFGQRP